MRAQVILIAALLTIGMTSASAELIYKNTPDGFTPDGATYFRDSYHQQLGIFIDDCWTAEDFYIDPVQYPDGVYLEEIRWVGRFNQTVTDWVAQYAIIERVGSLQSPVYDERIIDDGAVVDPNTGATFTREGAATGTAVVDTFSIKTNYSIEADGDPHYLEAGKHYYVGVRLVTTGPGAENNGVACVVDDANYAPTSHSLTSALHERSGAFVLPWTLVSNLDSTSFPDKTEYAIDLYGVIPEPGSIVLLVAGLGLVWRRR
ncbi:MAG: PEP-CTERM sorting domain-containing protein [Phycisphaerae bacterium]|nr:PEP-CTERM sorting domain-containing protein [Phycisphaerae bacterium]